jgi:thiol-disulfide isomerase/thioredoxin
MKKISLAAIASVLLVAGSAWALEPEAPAKPESKPAVPATPIKPMKDEDGKPAKPRAPRPELLKVGIDAPDWELKDTNGATVKLSDLRGKVVLMDFWATWCPPCREVMPKLQKMHTDLASKGLVVLGMNTWEDNRSKEATPESTLKKVTDFLEKNKYTYRNIMGSDTVAKTYAVSGIPTFYLINHEGKIVHVGVGAGKETEAKLKAEVEKALAAIPADAKPVEETKPAAPASLPMN